MSNQRILPCFRISRLVGVKGSFQEITSPAASCTRQRCRHVPRSGGYLGRVISHDSDFLIFMFGNFPQS